MRPANRSLFSVAVQRLYADCSPPGGGRQDQHDHNKNSSSSKTPTGNLRKLPCRKSKQPRSQARNEQTRAREAESHPKQQPRPRAPKVTPDKSPLRMTIEDALANANTRRRPSPSAQHRLPLVRNHVGSVADTAGSEHPRWIWPWRTRSSPRDPDPKTTNTSTRVHDVPENQKSELPAASNSSRCLHALFIGIRYRNEGHFLPVDEECPGTFQPKALNPVSEPDVCVLRCAILPSKQPWE